MGAVVIIVGAPSRDQFSGMAQVGEQVLVQALVPQAAVEAFHEAVLHRLSRSNVVPLDLAILLPFQNGVRGQLRPIIADHHAGIATRSGDVIEFPSYALPRQRGIDHTGQAFPAEVIDDAQDTEPAPIRQAV